MWEWYLRNNKRTKHSNRIWSRIIPFGPWDKKPLNYPTSRRINFAKFHKKASSHHQHKNWYSELHFPSLQIKRMICMSICWLIQSKTYFTFHNVNKVEIMYKNYIPKKKMCDLSLIEIPIHSTIWNECQYYLSQIVYSYFGQ